MRKRLGEGNLRSSKQKVMGRETSRVTLFTIRSSPLFEFPLFAASSSRFSHGSDVSLDPGIFRVPNPTPTKPPISPIPDDVERFRCVPKSTGL